MSMVGNPHLCDENVMSVIIEYNRRDDIFCFYWHKMCVSDSVSWEKGTCTYILIDGSGITISTGKGQLSPVLRSTEGWLVKRDGHHNVVY